MNFNWRLCDSKSPLVSRTLLSILVDLNNAEVWMVSTRPLISKSSSHLLIVPSASITIGIIVTFIFHVFFFNSLARSRYLSFLSFSFNFTSWFLLLLITIRSDRLAEIRWSVCMLKSQRSLCVSFSRTNVGLCVSRLFIWSSLNFLRNTPWIPLSTLPCRVLYSISAYLQHSLKWLIVWSQSPHNLQPFCCFFSILALIWLVSILALIWLVLIA